MDSFVERGRRVLELEAEEVRRMAERLDASFSDAIDLLAETLACRGKIGVCGVGKSGCIGEKMAATFSSTGAPAVVLSAGNALHGDLGVVAEGDVLIALSNSGETEELLRVIPLVMRSGVPVIAMTGGVTSTLARVAKIVLDVGVEHEACPLQLAPTCSTTAMLAMGDALAMVLLERRGFTREKFAMFHPAGSLGRALLLKVDEVMRGTDRMALISPEALVGDAVVQMGRMRCGCAAVVDGDGGLVGLFTHGDFARCYARDRLIGETAIGVVMTKNPVVVKSGALAVEAVRILEEHRIDDLIVVDERRRVCGLVDSQDLARWKLV
jgi:arabinose-5-phosphate isomerase